MIVGIGLGPDGATQFASNAADWRELAEDLMFALDQLETLNRKAAMPVVTSALAVRVHEDCCSVELVPCAGDGSPPRQTPVSVRLAFPELPLSTGLERKDCRPAQGSIDRAVCKVASDMMSWTMDPDTFEVLEHCRLRLFLCWPDGSPVAVDRYAYGLWDA